ncbi:uncharacterized protein BCR38DRAFT_420234 [Pseudomassariella vexata]|uniref:Zn(2)-C6 fungal-type domain-containing protein n=1 Tax=Pseudomassariella vexata TaxID=1141098 RepID=A0A1Y2EE48_9PEZI|nr:uncharacterized protein BCR38DRAFT_420234 [Pseudomassariella vexata]ORY69851.1 hypothetical protein BCR38DRAFT_420234 [Pseudomassariella vexata]
MMPLNDSSTESAANPGTGSGEPLACINCRNRKLRCDRAKPACTRCARLNTDCIYPESRRKPAFKRRNVKELEARLAQVEVLLQEAGGNRNAPEDKERAREAEVVEFDFSVPPVLEHVFLEGLDYTEPITPIDGDHTFSMPQSFPYAMPSAPSDAPRTSSTPFSDELMGLGISEPLPPFEVMEELNRIFFERHAHFVPLINPTRYLQAFYSAPHMKPPMCLQYAVWALACNGNDKYGSYHDIFYQRARQYAEADEMKGYGEHFITVAHAQAWCCIATDEAKSMLFTRAAMSSARTVRLVEMMGLHRLDCPPEEISPTLQPPADWQELEERRRTFWGAFCIDSHCSISTGWPNLIDSSEITTHLPASEWAFHSGQEAESCRIDQAVKGFSYSSFGATVLICHLFNQILKHAHRPKPNDNPDDYDYGGFWQRHREIDNTLSSAFMFLPSGFRMPENYRDPTAVHTNLNLHASVICLHHAAIDKIDKHKLPNSIKKASQDRLLTAAQEIVNIIKTTTSVDTHPKSSLAALSLYCAASVYIYQCKDTQPSPTNIGNLDFIISAMDAIGRAHVITRAFLKQLILDIDRNGIRHFVKLRKPDYLGPSIAVGSHNIPLLVRSNISRHSEMQPPLPGRLPLGNPKGNVSEDRMGKSGTGYTQDTEVHEVQSGSSPDQSVANQNLLANTSSSVPGLPPRGNDCAWSQSRVFRQTESSSSNPSPPEMSTTTNTTPPVDQYKPPFAYNSQYNPDAQFAGVTHNLPHRTSSTGMNPQKGVDMGNNTFENVCTTEFRTAGRDSNAQVRRGIDNWDMASVCMQAPFRNSAVTEQAPWTMLNGVGGVDWSAGQGGSNGRDK